MSFNKRNKGKNNSGDAKSKWIFNVILMAFGLSVFFSFVSSSILEHLNLYLSMGILFCIILIGIVFDIIGVAVTSATEAPFHAMGANKVKGYKEAITLIRNADKVSSVCNDVVGDISGIISGAAGTTIVLKAFSPYSPKEVFGSVLMAGFISTLTIGGKALGKRFALDNSKKIVYDVAILLYHFKERFYLLFNKSSRANGG